MGGLEGLNVMDYNLHLATLILNTVQTIYNH